ncbi:MAG: ATP-binding protein [Armatimonadota bacterium]|nr:ATP-binding protein [Armatimonadota bacterium]
MSIRELIARLVEERRSSAPSSQSAEEPEVRLAVYDSPLAAPQVMSLRGDDFHALVSELATRTYQVCRERGGRVPFVVIREIMENLIHAYFRNATITVLDEGNTIRIADQGPGITDKERALQPGFSTATAEMRRYIRGVGSGLPVAKEQLQFLGGTLTLEDNLDRGTVVTLSVRGAAPPEAVAPAPEVPPRRHLAVTPRQKKVLLLIAELGAVGPTTIAKELNMSHSTAYRELLALQTLGLITGKGRGKRTLTEEGIAYLDEVFKP